MMIIIIIMMITGDKHYLACHAPSCAMGIALPIAQPFDQAHPLISKARRILISLLIHLLISPGHPVRIKGSLIGIGNPVVHQWVDQYPLHSLLIPVAEPIAQPFEFYCGAHCTAL